MIRMITEQGKMSRKEQLSKTAFVRLKMNGCAFCKGLRGQITASNRIIQYKWTISSACIR